MRPGDELRLELDGSVLYGVVLRSDPRFVARIRRGGPHGMDLGDVRFDHHPTRGEICDAVRASPMWEFLNRKENECPTSLL